MVYGRGHNVLVISSTVDNEYPTELTVIVVSVFDAKSTAFGVDRRQVRQPSGTPGSVTGVCA
jgi:hypothetical protein